MKVMALIIFLSFLGLFAHADSASIKYGRDLCDHVSFRDSTQERCENWVIDNSDENPYAIALIVCSAFNEGPSSRTAECFERASKWLVSKDVKDQVDLCAARNGKYAPQAECLRSLFFKMNSKVNESKKIQKQSLSSSGVK